MFNYIKFALFQIFGFLLSIPELVKLKINEKKYTSIEKFKFIKSHAKKSLDLVKIKIKIIGKEKVPQEEVLFVLNHASMLDSYILVSSIVKPIGVIIADVPTWRHLPIVSHWLNMMKCVYINRENNREGMKSIIKASENIKKGQSMAIFPEGDLTWVKDPDALISDFKPGAFKIAYKAKCPIVPIVIKNSRKTYEGYEPIGRINSGNVEVEYPVTVDEKLRFHIKPSVSYLYHRYCANVNFCIGMIVLLVAVWNSGDTLTETKRRVKMACILLTLIIYGMCIGVEAVQIGVKYVALFILFSIYVLLDCFRLRSKKTNGILGAVLICLFLYSCYYLELLLWLWLAWLVFSYKNSYRILKLHPK